MGKRKAYKHVYGGNPDDSKRCRYSGNSIDAKATTRGFLMSYRRNTLKQTHREAFSIAKHFTNQLYPNIVDKNGDRVVEKVEEDHVDIEKQLIAESKADINGNDRMFHIYETGVGQTLFMDVRHESIESAKVLDIMWETILADNIGDDFRVPGHLERLLPIQRICIATKEEILETLKEVIGNEVPKDQKEFYIMPRVRFHASLDRDNLLEFVRQTMKEIRPEASLNWKNKDQIIFVEILKKNCYIGVFKFWEQRQKYNWQEYHKRQRTLLGQPKEDSRKEKGSLESTKAPVDEPKSTNGIEEEPKVPNETKALKDEPIHLVKPVTT